MLLKSELSQDLEALMKKVIGAAIEVHKHLGPGFLESVYEAALCHELTLQRINFERQKEIEILYKNIAIKGQRLDLVVEQQLILELKAVEAILPIHTSQVISYLKATGLRASLILNFKSRLLTAGGIKRVLL
ncbi:MAG: GxxExxY protein [Acidobacteria bacterium]|nr:GxxExxY protein [Acidobacteriota bacterium]